MKKNKDYTPHICAICKETIPVCGMGSHLYHKHGKMTSDEYAKQFGEFRKKHINLNQRYEAAADTFECKECGFKAYSHKQLTHHIGAVHGDWKEYYIKHYFNGQHPTCKCGCGEKVNLLRNGDGGKTVEAYRRDFITGHDTRLRQVGYRTNTVEQRETMRRAAIKRMQTGNSTFHNSGPSKSEQEVFDFILQLGVKAEQSNKELLAGLEVDILIPDYKLAIEFNGSHFHSDLFKQDKRYHIKKTEELARKGYRLFHVWEPDWYECKDIVKSMLKNILGKTGVRVYARNTVVKTISRDECNKFLNENHLQGAALGKHYYGLYHKEKLISVMSFSKLRHATGKSHKEGEFELLRFCTKLDTTVVGGASKLFSKFVQEVQPDKVLSYANRDWSQGKVYTQLRMEFEGYTPPGYFYVKSKRRYSRVAFQKHKLVAQGEDEALTEFEIMTKNGYVRIWNCGNLKYTWTK